MVTVPPVDVTLTVPFRASRVATFGSTVPPMPILISPLAVRRMEPLSPVITMAPGGTVKVPLVVTLTVPLSMPVWRIPGRVRLPVLAMWMSPAALPVRVAVAVFKGRARVPTEPLVEDRDRFGVVRVAEPPIEPSADKSALVVALTGEPSVRVAVDMGVERTTVPAPTPLCVAPPKGETLPMVSGSALEKLKVLDGGAWPTIVPTMFPELFRVTLSPEDTAPSTAAWIPAVCVMGPALCR